jgi:XTP/dITP diphosphohydrolase
MTTPASGEPLLEFLAVMRQLRAECPWKREQTHRSLARYLLEEAHETLEAIDSGDATGDWDHLREELGDLLLQVYFHAVVAEETGAFTINHVARGITEKMHRRNPHVFGPPDSRGPMDAAAVNDVWQAIKEREKPRTSVTDGLPETLPALLYAAKVVERTGSDVGPTIRLPAPEEEVTSERRRIGDDLLELVREAVAAGVDPEQALRDAVRRLV